MLMPDFRITRGFDIKLAGRPLPDVSDCLDSAAVAVYPKEFPGLKQRLKVKEGDLVERGTELMENKRDQRFRLCSPAGGTVTSITRGERRLVEKILIQIGLDERATEFRRYAADEMSGLDREEILNQLLNTGYISLLRQRPFSCIPDTEVIPKSIFVNGTNTGPFQADAKAVVQDDPQAFQAGLDLLARLTAGAVHLCISDGAGDTLRSARNVRVHTFSGPHPSGNTSVHISRIDPMVPTDVVWTARAVDVVLIGRLFLDGKLPVSRIISLGGPGVDGAACRHYRVRIGGDLEPLLRERLAEGEQRLVNGDVFSGSAMEKEHPCLRLQQSSITVLPEGRERRFLGWTMPGFNLLSFTRAVASSWLGRNKSWRLNTSTNGGVRALVLTGHYDRVMPLNIMVDFLVRAVLAGDTDEAISLGILETDPEDFALCDFICPSKTEVQAIIRRGLRMIQEEGI